MTTDEGVFITMWAVLASWTAVLITVIICA